VAPGKELDLEIALDLQGGTFSQTVRLIGLWPQAKSRRAVVQGHLKSGGCLSAKGLQRPLALLSLGGWKLSVISCFLP